MLYSRRLNWKGMKGILISYSKTQTIHRIVIKIVIAVGFIDQWCILDFPDGWVEREVNLLFSHFFPNTA